MNGQMPHFEGDAEQMRAMIAGHAAAAEREFGRLITTDRDAGFKHGLLAHHASLYGWSVVALLGLIRRDFGDEAFQRAASMVDLMGTDGGVPYWPDWRNPDDMQEPAPDGAA